MNESGKHFKHILSPIELKNRGVPAPMNEITSGVNGEVRDQEMGIMPLTSKNRRPLRGRTQR